MCRHPLDAIQSFEMLRKTGFLEFTVLRRRWDKGHNRTFARKNVDSACLASSEVGCVRNNPKAKYSVEWSESILFLESEAAAIQKKGAFPFGVAFLCGADCGCSRFPA
jgi:hypothetical protein